MVDYVCSVAFPEVSKVAEVKFFWAQILILIRSNQYPPGTATSWRGVSSRIVGATKCLSVYRIGGAAQRGTQSPGALSVVAVASVHGMEAQR